MDVFKAVMALSFSVAGWVSLPLPQAQTTTSALMKHRRMIEDELHGAKLDVTHQVTVTYTKDGSLASDKRQVSQPVLFVTPVGGNQQTNAWLEGTVYKNQILGPLPLIPVSHMIGYDTENRPGAAARVEQWLDVHLTVVSFAMFVSNKCFWFIFQQYKLCLKIDSKNAITL